MPSSSASSRSSPSPSQRGSKRWRCLRILFWGGVGLMSGLGAWVWYEFQQLPDLTPVQSSVESGRFDYPPGILPSRPASYTDFPPYLIAAVVAIEDRRFYSHAGLDWQGIGRAFLSNLRAGEVVEGGSTISQQLVKNLYLSSEQSWERKAREALMALALEQKLTKEEILTLYLNRVYFGAGSYGVGAAAYRYFGKPVSRLSVAESATLAGLLQAPSLYAPTVNPNQALSRRNEVLRAMQTSGSLNEPDAQAAMALPLGLMTPRTQ